MKKRTIDNVEDLLYRAMRLAKTAIESIDNQTMQDSLRDIYVGIDGEINRMEEREDR